MRSLIAVALSLGLVGASAVAVIEARKRFLMIRVTGPSMEPTLHDGAHVVARRIGLQVRLGRGDIVVVRRLGDHDGATVKRVTALPGETPAEASEPVPAGHLWLVGDGTSSYDSRHAGPVPRNNVLARVDVEARVGRGRQQSPPAAS
ncbi:S26 family signal peptidase [Propionibacteriaceae bacterium Y1700]|uniref:S26 family signal peptidase n=1 Tax=Microlunatus sp. Y1700 TaxID=3418487 RepID=UPI003DA767C2